MSATVANLTYIPSEINRRQLWDRPAIKQGSMKQSLTQLHSYLVVATWGRDYLWGPVNEGRALIASDHFELVSSKMTTKIDLK